MPRAKNPGYASRNARFENPYKTNINAMKQWRTSEASTGNLGNEPGKKPGNKRGNKRGKKPGLKRGISRCASGQKPRLCF